MKHMLPMVPLMVCGFLMYVNAPWWVMGFMGLPAFLIFPGWGFAQRFGSKENATQLQLILDSIWFSLFSAWMLIALLRETGLGNHEQAPYFLLTATGIVTAIGLVLAKKFRFRRPSPDREKRGIIWVIAAALCVVAWKHNDLSRTLDKYWYLTGADDVRNEHVPLKPSRGWTNINIIGDSDAHAMSMTPTTKNPDLIAKDRVNGRVILAVRGPIGSSISAGGVSNTVKRDMAEGKRTGECHWNIAKETTCPETQELNSRIGEWGPGNACLQQEIVSFDKLLNYHDAPYGGETDDDGAHCLYSCTYQCLVPRYQTHGMAAISVWVDLQPGQYFGLDVTGDEVYLLPSVDALWAADDSGTIKYTDHYQILNQVENMRWAEEMLVDRRFTWNQPPGWSPILSLSGLITAPDLNGASALFIWVIVLIGLSAVRLCSLVAPHANTLSGLIIAMMMIAHGQLMIVPGSINFPDSLYTASLLAVAIALANGSWFKFGLFGAVSQSLRWPGAILSIVFWLCYKWRMNNTDLRGLYVLAGFVFIGMGVAGLAMFTGDADDLLFILYFETFPEHWHGNYNPLDLIRRVPLFYGKWLMYTGGALILIMPFAFGARTTIRNHLQAILVAVLIYSAMLATIDHHPSHYFLPLAAFTAPCLIAASELTPNNTAKHVIIVMSSIGYGAFLWNGIV